MPIVLDGDVTVSPPTLPAVKAAPPATTSVTVLPVAGPTGPPGAAGAPGGSTYTHTQSTPAASWAITHNLGRYPQVTVVDTTGDRLFPDLTYDSINTVTVTHASPTAGFAYL